MAEAAPPPPAAPTTEEHEQHLSAQVVIVGGGPAGLVAAALFARAGASTLVVESHDDFLRDFRGDTVHPSTLTLFSELGWLDEFLALPHNRADGISATFADVRPNPPTLKLADFSRLKGSKDVPCPFVALMPQDVFLEFVHKKASEYGEGRYKLVRGAKATGLLHEDPSQPDTSRVVGVRATLKNENNRELIARASALVVAADGRRSAVRAAANLPPAIFPGGAPPIDVLWFQIPRDEALDPPGQTQGFVSRGTFLVSLYRGSYYQCGLLIAKGGAEKVRAAGLPAFAKRVSAAVSYLSAERVERALPRFFGPADAEYGERQQRDVHVLDVRVDRLCKWWRPGLVCIGDAAHAMSPVGGVGINLAIQDAVALANQLAAKVAAGSGEDFRVADADLAAVQKRREFPTRATQAMQVMIQRNVIGKVLGLGAAEADVEEESSSLPPLKPPLPLRLFDRFPALRYLPARLVGLGFRPEHILSPEKAVR
jgi:2-polyprenyl-6-methoxyphenol hydroxylase-like FAD-dependent oxidoreductase